MRTIALQNYENHSQKHITLCCIYFEQCEQYFIYINGNVKVEKANKSRGKVL